jgi:dihydrofolate synthase/folylpolyglutamate synthase
VVSEAFVIDFIAKNKSFFESHNLSFFEMTVGMAFDYFSEQKVDIAIIEVGLGGRLDSTNIITPLVSVITNIGMDHTQFLGNTLDAIALEKAGIIKPNIPVVIGETQVETEPVFIEVARKNNADISFADKEVNETFESDLKGIYQKHNIKTAIQTIKQIPKASFRITVDNIKSGLLNVVNNTGLKGRWQILQLHPKVICDAAHNKEGLVYVMRQLNEENFEKLHIVFGVVNDKDLKSILPLMPKQATYYFCKPNIERGLDAEILRQVFKEYGIIGHSYLSVNMALIEAKTNARRKDLIYVGGSTFVVAEII